MVAPRQPRDRLDARVMRGFLSIENVSKRFGAAVAVDSVDLAIARGEFFSLLGPSGCGKTTLLRIIGGFTAADAGAIWIDGEDVTESPPNRRAVNMVFQSYAIFPHLNVAENIAYGLRADRVPREERQRRVAEALDLISLTGYSARRANQLSGGERQRVALARALVKRPKVLLLDEPLGALDKRLRESMQTELRNIQREVGITFVFVTHDQEEALAMSDRIAVMEHGRVLQVASPATLYDRPVSRAVASFIGTMNFLDCAVMGPRNGGIALNVAGFGIITVPSDTIFSTGAPVVAAIRPEKLIVSSGGAGVAGRVASAVYLGDRIRLKVAIAGIATALTISAAPSALIKAGDEVRVALPPEHLLLLPK